MAARFQNWIKRNLWDNSESIVSTNGSLLQSILSYDSFTDEPVTIRKALKVSTVYTCVTVPSKTIASLPINVIQEQGNKKVVLTDHPVYYSLAHEPSAVMSSFNFIMTLMVHLFAWGNAYGYIHRDSRQNPDGYDIWEPWEVTISYSEGRYWYHYKGETVPARDVIHLRMYSFDGICGRSPIMENQNTIGQAIKLDRYQSLITGARPPGILSYDGNLSPEQIKQNEERWKRPGSGTKVMDGKWNYQSIMTNPEASQFVEAKRMNQQELYGIWELPPAFAQNLIDYSYATSEQADLVYAKHTISPTIRMAEQEFNLKLFKQSEKATTYVKFNLNGLLRGDLVARQAFYQAMVNTGVMSRNEARSYEDLNPYVGGDDFLVQGAMVPADLLRKNMEAMIESSKTPPPTNEKPAKKDLTDVYNGYRNGVYQ